MKTYILTIAISILFISSYSQSINYNLEDGYIANGYDVVSYFKGSPVEGNSNYTYSYDGIKFKFSNQSNLDAFKSNPEKYMPQYGGWCAYAVGSRNKKVTIDPKTFEIRNGKLYLFYNSFFNNTLTSWEKEGPEQLILKADKNWEKLKDKN